MSKEEEPPKYMSTELINPVVTGVNSASILYLLYNNFTTNEAVANIIKGNKILLSNLNLLNMQFLRWIAIFSNKNFETDSQVEILLARMNAQEKRIEELEKIIKKT